MRQRRSPCDSGWRRLLTAMLFLSLSAFTNIGHAQEPDASPPEASDASPSAADGMACSRAYHASLGRIAETEYAAVKAARDLVASGDDRLPGALLFPPAVAGRTNEEARALAVANTLARSRGSSNWRRDADSRWITERLRLDLADYLNQKPSPYLCGGVENYVDTLRKFARRLGVSPSEREALIKTQRGAAERSITVALVALRPAPPPRFAPVDRPAPMGDLRPTISVVREDVQLAEVAEPDVPRSDAAAPEDSDLPPLKTVPIRLESVADLTAAIDRLIAASHRSGLVTGTANDMAFGTGLAVTVSSHPVLARFALARPYVTGPRPLVEDRVARLALTRAFSDMEALDYLMRAQASGGDPMAAAIDRTFEAILSAKARDCGCEN